MSDRCIRHDQADYYAACTCGKLIEVEPMEWTTAPPTVPGFYWAARTFDTIELVRVERVPDEDQLRVHTTIDNWYLFVGDWEQWCGPIEAPPLPEKT